MRWPDIRPAAILHLHTGEQVLSKEQAERLREAFRDGLLTANEMRPLVLEHGFDYVPMRSHQPYTCKACGAPVRSTEMACTYCTTERPAQQFERIEVTSLNDEEPKYLLIPQPARDSR